MAKTVLPSKFVEWKGLDRISQIVHEMKCIWREITKDDFGIDGEIEVVIPKATGEGFETTGNVIKVQAKSGDSYVVQDSTTGFSTPVTKTDLEQWSKANYPVLLIVYHPKDDKLYCKEIRAYVRSTLNVFQTPLRVRFSKPSDEFTPEYFTAIRTHAESSQPRVSLQQREQLYSNLLPVRRLPTLMHASTEKDADSIRDSLSGQDWSPFCVIDGRLFTLGNLRDASSTLRQFCDSDIESMTVHDWLDAEPERRGDYVYLLNQLLGKLRYRLGLRYNKAFDRTYFPRENDADKEFMRTWYNARSNKPAPARAVARYYEYGLYKFWRHLACHLSFTQIDQAWFLRIVPRYFFTTDGVTPWDSELVGPYTTSIKAQEHNIQVLNHVLFWADALAEGKDFIALYLDGRMVLNIDRLPMSGIATFAIVDDPATFEEEPPPAQLELFKLTEDDDDD